MKYKGLVNSYPHKATIDHKVPFAKGGISSLENKVLCCRECNGNKGDKLLEEWFIFVDQFRNDNPGISPNATTIG
jgi:5-methylcytosine-specific restriction endonuclease McrA